MRTDRTFVCTGCRVRSWPVRRCPACGETKYLGDLEQRSLADLEQGRPAAPSDPIGAMLVAGGLLGCFGSAFVFGAGHVGAAEVGVASSIGAIVYGLVRKRAPAVSTGEPYQLLESPIVRASTPRASHRGRVRARQTIVSPLTNTPCVAWRLVDPSGKMPLDDGRAVPFALLAGADEVEVDATIATLELAVPQVEPRALDTADPELARWLRARGIDPAGPIEVREAIVVDGDEIEVIGTARIEARADGYRGHSTREVLADQPGSPLVLRAPPAAIGDAHVTIA